jgi:hypothetical protein
MRVGLGFFPPLKTPTDAHRVCEKGPGKTVPETELKTEWLLE